MERRNVRRQRLVEDESGSGKSKFVAPNFYRFVTGTLLKPLLLVRAFSNRIEYGILCNLARFNVFDSLGDEDRYRPYPAKPLPP